MAERGQTNDVKTDENVTFTDLAISELTINSLTQAGFMKPSPIQLQALPLALVGLDLLIQAKSGTGKTLVFSITALEFVQIDDNDDNDSTVIRTKVIMLAPTREIAQQIVHVIRSIKQPECIVHTFIGGTALKDDQNHLKKCHIVVGTPGRVEELLRLKYLRADTIRLLVLDEADVLLCKEFQVIFCSFQTIFIKDFHSLIF
jgi:ATP-dependent RNA helicase DDX20